MSATRWHLNLITAPTAEPLSLPEAKIHCRVTQSEDDEYLADLIVAAREYVEMNIPGGRQLVSATWDYIADRLPCGRERLELPKPPLVSVTSVTCYDAANVSTVMPSSDYVVLAATSLPGAIQPASGAVWPATYCRDDAVSIRFVAGYGTASAVPMRAKQAMRLLVAHWYDQREPATAGALSNVPHGVDQLLQSLGWGYVL